MSNKQKAFDIVFTICLISIYMPLFIACIFVEEWLFALISLAATLNRSYMLYRYFIEYNIVR